MWDDIEAHRIIQNQDRFIDKLELVRDFIDLHRKRCKDFSLSIPSDLNGFLSNEIESNFGVYCICNTESGEALYVGESKRLRQRIREQLIGVRDRKTKLLKYTRLFFAVLKIERELLEKKYNDLPVHEKRTLIEFYQNIIYRPDNRLRVCFTDDHVKAIVLENVLIRHFTKKDQCKYNFYGRKRTSFS